MADSVDVREVVPGEYDVTVAGTTHRVLVPAGVGIPGVPEEELVGAVVVELRARGRVLPATLDVTFALRDEPGLLDAVEDQIDTND